MNPVLLALAPAIFCLAFEDPLPQLATPQSLDMHAVSPDGTVGVSFDGDDAWVVDLRTGLPLVGVDIGPYRPAGDHWTGGRFSDDGRRLTLWSFCGSAALVDVETRRVVNQLAELRTEGGFGGKADAVGRRLVQAGAGKLVVRELATGEVVGAWPCFKEEAFVLGADGSFVVLDRGTGLVRIDLDGEGEPVQLTVSGVAQVELLPDGTTALLVHESGARRVELADGRVHAEVVWPEGGWRLSGIDAQGRCAVVSNGTNIVRCLELDELTLFWEFEGASWALVEPRTETVWLWRRESTNAVHDLRTGKELWKHTNERWGMWRLGAAGADGSVTMHLFRSEESVRVDARTGERVTGPPLARADAWRSGFLDDGVAWVVLRRGALLAIDAQSGKLLATREPGAKPTDVHGAGGRVVVAGADGKARVFEGRELEPKAHFECGASVGLSADGARVGTWGGELAGLRFVDALDGHGLESYGLELGKLGMAAWSDDGTLVAASSYGGRAHLWRAGEPVELANSLGNMRSLAIDPAGRWLALGGTEARLVVLDTKGAERAELEVEGWWGFGLRLSVLAFDPTGAHLVATTGDSGSVHVWRTSDWQRAWVLDHGGGNGDSIQLAFDAGGTRVWAWGMTYATQAQFALASGEQEVDLGGTELWDFASSPDGTRSCATREGVWVLLGADGRVLLERADLPGRGAVVLDVAGDAISGDPAALEGVFVRRGTQLAPACD